MASTRTRRTQADRSAKTKAALADAAIEVLIEQGWAAVTAIEVCNRVGVTRGAFHHHYDNVPDLLADALQGLYSQMVNKTPNPPTDLTGLIDNTWAAISNPRFKAVLEAWLAMANNPSLGAELGPVVADFARLVNPDTMTALLTNKQRRDFYLTARETMLGLALGRATNKGKPLGQERRVLAHIRANAHTLDNHEPSQ
jgi:AcrR family transcriptional regulator